MNLKPGRKLDALIAEKVMGISQTDFKNDRGEWESRTHFSTSIEAAWEVVEHLKSRDLLFSLRQRESGKYRAMFFEADDDGKTFKSTQDTAPHAICLAALKAVEKT